MSAAPLPPGDGQNIASIPVGISSAIKLPNGDAVGGERRRYIRADGVRVRERGSDYTAPTDTGSTRRAEFASVTAIMIRESPLYGAGVAQVRAEGRDQTTPILGSPTRPTKGLFNAGHRSSRSRPTGSPCSTLVRRPTSRRSGLQGDVLQTGDTNAWDLFIPGRERLINPGRPVDAGRLDFGDTSRTTQVLGAPAELDRVGYVKGRPVAVHRAH